LKYSENDIDRLFNNIYNGKTTVQKPPQKLYSQIAQHLGEGVRMGFGSSDPNSIMLEDLVDNVYYFSAAKTFQQVKQMQEAIIGSNGHRVPYSEFKKTAFEIFDTYNTDWLKTEYNTAVGQSQNAELWENIMRDAELFPILTYITTQDERVCPICAPLDRFTARATDSIWGKIMPSNHYNCLCTVVQQEDGVALSTNKPDIENIPPEFQFNPGESRMVFPPSHPYFKVEKKYEKLKENNFNLPAYKTD